VTPKHPLFTAGPKAQRKFRRLMMVRMKWDEDKKGNKIGETRCRLLFNPCSCCVQLRAGGWL